MTIGNDVAVQLNRMNSDRGKAQAMKAMRAPLYRMDSRNGDVQTLRRQLNHIFPLEQSEKEQLIEVSNG